MAHEKVYAVCENKCFVETMTKEQIETGLNEVEERIEEQIEELKETKIIRCIDGDLLYFNLNKGERVLYIINNGSYTIKCNLPSDGKTHLIKVNRCGGSSNTSVNIFQFVGDGETKLLVNNQNVNYDIEYLGTFEDVQS